MFYVTKAIYLPDNILLFFGYCYTNLFCRNWIKIKKKILTKIPKHALARFCGVVSQTPQFAYFSSCILWAIASKVLTIYAVADKNLS